MKTIGFGPAIKLSSIIGNDDAASVALETQRTAWNLERIPIPGDANCFFTAVAWHLQRIFSSQTVTTQSRTIISHLLSIGITHTMNLNEMAHILRRLVVEEWTSNCDRYQPFLHGEMHITEIAREFIHSGVHDAELGDAMPLAMANILSQPIVLLTSLQSTPFLNILPNDMSVPADSEFVITLAYNHVGSGHYDVLTPMKKIIAEG